MPSSPILALAMPFSLIIVGSVLDRRMKNLHLAGLSLSKFMGSLRSFLCH